MKSLFVHLSDIHLTEYSADIFKIDKMFCGLADRLLSADLVFVIFTGDLSRSSRREQLSHFKNFMDEVLLYFKSVNDVPINVLIVPGNHDINLTNEKKSSYIFDCPNNYSPEDLDRLSLNELNKMNYALLTCEHYDCFKDDNKFVCNKKFRYGDVNYSFTLINSAPFSSLYKKDKDHHHIPKDYLILNKNLEIGVRTINVLLSHHRIDWFDDCTIEPLRSFFENDTSISFFGHEHTNKEYEFVSENGKATLVMQAGELKSKRDNVLSGSFSFLLLDDLKMECSTGEYCYDYEKESLTFNSIYDNKQIRFFEPFSLNEKFKEEAFASPLRTKKGTISDIFVMPSLYRDGKTKINSLNDLIEIAKKNGKVFINGNAKIGKTILLKQLFLELKKNYVPVLLKCNDSISPIVKNAIEDSFKQEYDNSNIKLKEFNALPKEKKVLLVDNFDKLKNELIFEKLLEYAEHNFSFIIGTYFRGFDPETRLKLDSLVGMTNRYDLNGFTYAERRSFISKICGTMGVDRQDEEKVINLYESTITTSKILDFTDPEYGMMLVEEIINSGDYKEREKSNAFSIVFLDSINSSFKNAGCGNKLEDCVIITSWIAWKLWKTNVVTFSEDVAIEAFNECRDYYGTVSIEFNKFFRCLLDSQIVTRYEDKKYKFRRITYLSYFAGRQIALNYKTTGDDANVVELIRNINFGINSDILLFVSYELKDKTIFEQIKEKLDSCYSSFTPISLNKQNNRIITDFLQSEKRIAPIQMKSKEEYIENKDKKEKKQIEEGIDEQKIMNNSNDGWETNALKMIEILSKVVSGFANLFTAEERTNYINTIISSSLRLIQKTFTIDDIKYKKLESLFETLKRKYIDEIKDINEVSELISKINSLTIEEILYNYLISTIQVVELTVSDWMTSGVSQNFISKIDDNDYINQFIKLSSSMYMGNFTKFKNILAKIYESDSKEIKSFCSILVYYYILRNCVNKEDIMELSQLTGIRYEQLSIGISKKQLASK